MGATSLSILQGATPKIASAGATSSSRAGAGAAASSFGNLLSESRRAGQAGAPTPAADTKTDRADRREKTNQPAERTTTQRPDARTSRRAASTRGRPAPADDAVTPDHPSAADPANDTAPAPATTASATTDINSQSSDSAFNDDSTSPTTSAAKADDAAAIDALVANPINAQITLANTADSQLATTASTGQSLSGNDSDSTATTGARSAASAAQPPANPQPDAQAVTGSSQPVVTATGTGPLPDSISKASVALQAAVDATSESADASTNTSITVAATATSSPTAQADDATPKPSPHPRDQSASPRESHPAGAQGAEAKASSEPAANVADAPSLANSATAETFQVAANGEASSHNGPATPATTPQTAQASNAALSGLPGLSPQPAATTTFRPVTPLPAAADAQFVDANHPQIVTGISAKLLPEGGTMTIRLDPPELGALEVSVRLSKGQITATLEAGNADAARLMTHSLSSLRSGLEAAGVVVDRIEVSHNQKLSSGDGDGGSNLGRGGSAGSGAAGGAGAGADAQSRSQDRNRQEMLDRLWAKVLGEPLNILT